MNTNEIPTPITDAFKKEWPDHRRHNWPCSFESAAFAEIENIERSLTESRALSVDLVKQLLEVTGQRDSLCDALKACREDSICQHQRMLDMKYTVAAQQCEENIRRANEALNSLKP